MAVLVLLVAVQTREFAENRVLRERVNLSYQTRAQIEKVLSLHQDLETGTRGFVVTGDPQFLEPYNDARSRIWPEVALLRTMIVAERDRAFRGSIAAVVNLTRRKLEFSDRVISLRKNASGAAAGELIATGEGRSVMDELRATTARMAQIERRRLEVATERAESSRKMAQRLVYVLQALLLFLFVTATAFIARSLSATRNSERRLADLSARQQAIFDAATDGMIMHDPKGIIESLNPSAAAMYGYDASALIGNHINLLFDDPPSAEELEKFLGHLARNPQGKASRVQEFWSIRRDRTQFAVDVGTSPVSLQDGLHFLAVIRDATERKRVDLMKTEFVSTVSHELRTPLTSIAGSLGLLAGGAAGALSERAGKLISIAHANSQRLVRLINDILDIEKIESGEMAFTMEPLQLRPLLEKAIEANQSFASEYGVTFELASGGENTAITGDEDRLLQIFTNLLSNAAKFSPSGGIVVAAVKCGAATHRVTVSDQGPGIPEEFKSRIFSKFAQADSSDTRQKGGTGLGLSIVREMAARMGGQVSFKSSTSGTDFHVDFPALSTGSTEQPAKAILVYETDSNFADQFAEALSQSGFVTEIAANANDVRRLTSQEGYAAIVLDFSALGEEAEDLVRHVRSHPINASTPILIASSRKADGSVSQTLAVADWIERPMAPERLVVAVKGALSRHDGRRPRILHVEDDVDLLRVVSSAFEGRADLQSATDLASAREALKSSEFDLVILDIALPGGSGLELLPTIRRRDGTPTPVVIFSAKDNDPDLARRVEAVLIKSRASLADLVDTVDALMTKSADGERQKDSK